MEKLTLLVASAAADSNAHNKKDYLVKIWLFHYEVIVMTVNTFGVYFLINT